MNIYIYTQYIVYPANAIPSETHLWDPAPGWVMLSECSRKVSGQGATAPTPTFENGGHEWSMSSVNVKKHFHVLFCLIFLYIFWVKLHHFDLSAKKSLQQLTFGKPTDCLPLPGQPWHRRISCNSFCRLAAAFLTFHSASILACFSWWLTMAWWGWEWCEWGGEGW